MDPKLITPILFAALVAWGIYRRMRRTFGRQPVQTGRIWFRIGMLTLVGGAVLATSAGRNTQALEALIAGICCGAALAYLGLRHTQFEVTPEGRFYTPHTYIGLAVTALFLGRLLYRFLYLSNAQAFTAANENFAATYQRNPLTLGIFAALVGYYVVFYAGVLVKTRAPALPLTPSPSE
ncbi:MAG TPA: hypothetical protein VMG11_13530 [Steroidobacteraceae bacterium]|nr:hypothetical protein [Steroidobacteraceae bacterium]